MADCRFSIDRKSRVLTMTDFQAEGEEQSVTLEGGQMTLGKYFPDYFGGKS